MAHRKYQVTGYESTLCAVEAPIQRRKWLTFGERIIVIYFFVFYFIPPLTDVFTDQSVKYFLSGDIPFIKGVCFSIGYLSLFLLFRKTVNANIKIALPWRRYCGCQAFITAIFIMYMVVAFKFGQSFESSFRHAQSYASSGLIPVVTFALKMVCNLLIFAFMSSKDLIRLKPYHLVIYFIAWRFSFVGSYDIVYALLGFLALMKTLRINVITFLRHMFRRVSLFVLLIVIPLVVFAGMANKLGVDGAVAYFSGGWVSLVLELIGNRLLYHSYSLSMQVNNFMESFSLGLEGVEITVFQTIRRCLILLGFSIDSDIPQTISRLNYLVISNNNTASDAGASPGLLGSIFYLPGSCFLTPLHIIILYNVVAMFDNIMGDYKYSAIVYLAALAILQALMDSLPDNFNPFSIGFIAFFMFLTLSSYARQRDNRADAHKNVKARGDV